MASRNVDWSKAQFLISCVGMADAWMWSFEVDHTWLVIHGTPGAGLVPFRLANDRPASLEEVLFIANCIAFDHDVPTLIRPAAQHASAAMPLVEPVVSHPGATPGLPYYEAVEIALSMAAEVRFGAAVALRYDEQHPDLTEFGRRFADVLEPLSLYAMATRQVDPLAEYLCLYRVLEWPGQDNGRGFIEQHLDALAQRPSGNLMAVDPDHQPVDVLVTYQQRALARIATLNAGPSAKSISKHLYGVRNAIAHGKEGVAHHDFGNVVKGVGADLPIVKLLARMVVGGT